MTILFGVSMEDYLAAPDVSHSKLKDFARSPRLYYAAHVARTLPERGDTGPRIFGRAFEDLLCHSLAKNSHAALRGQALARIDEMAPRSFLDTYVVKPPDIDARTKEGKAWKAANAGRFELSMDEFASMLAMIQSIHEHDCFAAMAAECQQQVTIRAEVGGVPIQSRPDFVHLKGSALSEFRPYTLDLKTCEDIGRIESARAVVEYGYHRQAEMCGMALAGNGYIRDETAHYLGVVEKTLPHRCAVFEIEEAFLVNANGWVVRNLIALDECRARNEWPRYKAGVQMLRKPAWLKDEEEAAQ